MSRQPSQRQRCCIVVVVVAVLIVATAVAGLCGTGRCSAPTPSPVPARADTILSYINGITLSGRTLAYPSNSSAEERAVQWLVEDDLGTAVDDEHTLRQRYVLGTLWFQPTPAIQPTTIYIGFGSADHAASWTTNIDECEWLDVRCDDNGHVTTLKLGSGNFQGQIPHDLGLLTGLRYLESSTNQLSGTIPSSLGTLTALIDLDLSYNRLSGTIPSSLGALTALNRLYLFNNELSGTIPSSLGALTDLEWFYLHDNQLVGTMPFCNSDQSFVRLVADCMEVKCTCCTECCPVAFGNIPFYSYCDK
jgi:hypothetical protein